MRPRFVGQRLQVGGLAGKRGHIGRIGFEQSADGFVGAAEIFHITLTRSHIGIISIGVAEKGQQAEAEEYFMVAPCVVWLLYAYGHVGCAKFSRMAAVYFYWIVNRVCPGFPVISMRNFSRFYQNKAV